MKRRSLIKVGAFIGGILCSLIARTAWGEGSPPAQSAQLLGVLGVLKSLGYQTAVGPRFIKLECGRCENFIVCRGLIRAHQVELKGPERSRVTLTSYEYESPRRAELALSSMDESPLDESPLLLRRGTVVLRLGAAPGAKLEKQLRARGVGGQPSGLSVRSTRLEPHVFLDPRTPDAELRALALAARRDTAPPKWAAEIPSQLNRRGMRFLRTGQLNRAALAFELAAALDEFATIPAYNRACVAGRQGDAVVAVLWLWKLAFAHGMYGRPTGTEEGKKLLARSRVDKDLDLIRRSEELRAFQRVCRSRF